MKEKQKLAVAVMFDDRSQSLIEKLAYLMPVWVIESPENNQAVADARQKTVTTLTVFFKRESECKTDMCSRVIYSVSDHHKFDDLLVYGATPADISSEVASELGFAAVVQTDYGCRITRQ